MKKILVLLIMVFSLNLIADENTQNKTEMKSDFLKVSEKFFSIQGEGQTVGVPSIFLRLGGCNLLCQSKDWVCDSIAVWTNSNKVAFEDVFDSVDVFNLERGVHLVITGGEPLLHQRQIVRFLSWFESTNGFKPTIEVETNGTIVPIATFVQCVDYWNVSPKLSNSGEPFEKRFNKEALDWFNQSPKTGWKFVISKEEDLDEFQQDFNFIPLDKKMSFMPAGDSIESFAQTDQMVAELCKEFNVRFCPRLQISIYNMTTGV